MDVEMDQTPKEDQQQKPLMDRENALKNTPKEDQQQKPLMDRENALKNAKSKSSNLSIINYTSFLGEIRKEGLSTRVTVQKSHDFIREAMETIKKELVKDILIELNPRFNILEELLKEIKEELPTKKGESESGDSDNEDEEEEEEGQQENRENPPPAQQENQRPAQPHGEENNREVNNHNHGRRFYRGNGQNARRPRDSRLFYLLRQLDRERGSDAGYDRYRPYYPRDRGEFNRNEYRGRNDRRGYRR
uniref:Uncharacterized protein n=1 Tax=Meloidogyne enterolobii TaxID=390850 RepID=A0A6V7VXF6_MELEN|nr:unnamed protein product [Meloidogyne enterolobii]